MYFGVYLDISSVLGFLFQEGRTILYFIGFSYALYFYHTKIGFKLTASYSVSSDMYTESQISKIIISNHKDKTIPIWSIYAVIDNDIKIELFKPEEPLIVKYGEAVSLAPKKYTHLIVNGDKFEPEFFSNKIDIYVNVGNKIVKCKDVRIKDNVLKNLTSSTQIRRVFDGHLYNDQVEYILVYFLDGVKRTAFIDCHGFIGNEWSLAPNSFGDAEITPKLIETTLNDYGYNQMFSNFVCFKRTGNDFKVAFKKRT